MSFTIKGTGKAVPEFVLTNDDLTKMVNTSDEWITTRSGIKRRHIMTTETVTDLCTKAALDALEDANITPADLDLIICATISGDYITPSQACVIQERIGAKCPAFDVNGACSGFVYALDIADGYFARNRAERILVIGFDNLSSITDWTDRATCVLFGDGGGAVVLEKGDDLLSIHLTAKGNYEVLNAPRGLNLSPMSALPEQRSSVYMNGKEVYKFAVVSMVREIKRVIKEAGLTVDDISYVVPHQANARIIDAAADKLGIDKSKYIVNIEEYGNTAAGCMPIALDEINRSGKVKNGDILVMCAFGGGLTTGSCVIRWNK